MKRAREGQRRSSAGLGLIALLVLSGCMEKWWSVDAWRQSKSHDAPTTSSAPAEPRDAGPVGMTLAAGPRMPLPEGDVRRMYVELSVVKIDAPVGGIAAATRLWELVDQNAIPAALATAMRDNGFLIGVGRDEVRQAIAKVLRGIEGVRSRDSQVLVAEARSIDMQIRSEERDETVFYVGRDGQMTGHSFESARPLFKIEFDVLPETPDRIRLRLVPELRQPDGPARWEQVEGEFQLRPEYRGRIFRDLAVEAIIPPRGFLLVGPTRDVSATPLIGRPFLIYVDGDKPREYLYVVNPIIRWTGPPPSVSAADRR